jgi:hypothetical protein
MRDGEAGQLADVAGDVGAGGDFDREALILTEVQIGIQRRPYASMVLHARPRSLWIVSQV